MGTIPIKQRQAIETDSNAGAIVNAMVGAGVNKWVAGALYNRGVTDVGIAVGKYNLAHYHKMKNILAMGRMLADIVMKREPIVVVADYDCDGATACTIAVMGLRALGAKIDFVVPNRFVHGYGLTPGVVDVVADKLPRPKWIITVDNGIASNAGVAHANSLGIGVLVTDHHLPGDTLPDARCIVNPNQGGCEFESKNLAGCGVIYYVLAAVKDCLSAEGFLHKSVDLSTLLDVVSLGTVADVVKLDPNNRWLVKKGIKRIRSGLSRPGVDALFDVSRRRTDFAVSSDFGFSLGPRINAAGRLDDMSIGIRCLLADDINGAYPRAQELFDLNERRKDLEKTMREDAIRDIDVSNQDGRFTRVVLGDDFHEGVVGIVGSRIKDKTNTPVIVFANSQEEGVIKGSGRSIPQLHLRDALDLVHKRGDGVLEKFGGHAMAAGLSIRKEDLPTFIEMFEDATKEMMGGKLAEKIIWTDGELPNEALTAETAFDFADEVWGQGFEEPIWSGEFKVLDCSMVGKDQNHVRMTVGRGGEQWTAMHFFNTEEPTIGEEITLAYKLSYNEFRGNQDANLIVESRE